MIHIGQTGIYQTQIYNIYTHETCCMNTAAVDTLMIKWMNVFIIVSCILRPAKPTWAKFTMGQIQISAHFHKQKKQKDYHKQRAQINTI